VCCFLQNKRKNKKKKTGRGKGGRLLDYNLNITDMDSPTDISDAYISSVIPFVIMTCYFFSFFDFQL
jgi:hypothetical protein